MAVKMPIQLMLAKMLWMELEDSTADVMEAGVVWNLDAYVEE